MRDEMIRFIREHPEGVSSLLLAETFLKFKLPDETMAHRAVNAILHTDRRCIVRDDMRWYAATAPAGDSPPLDSLPWYVCFLLTGVHPQSGTSRPLFVSLQPLFQTDTLHPCSFWLIPRRQIPPQTAEMMIDGNDNFPSPPEPALGELCSALYDKTVIFLNSHQQRLFSTLCRQTGESPPDDTQLLSHLCKASGSDPAAANAIEPLHQELFGTGLVEAPAVKTARAVADICRELIRRCIERGLATRVEFDMWESENCIPAEVNWENKTFGTADIQALPLSPGVYGFTDAGNNYIYIGKARNLRRRVMTYFRQTDESPAKLTRLRQSAVHITTHPCGSELEGLILEHRLIDKYHPSLNTQRAINERPGSWTPLEDTIVLLPHAVEEMGMSIWIRREQKIRLQPFNADLHSLDTLREPLAAFFFTPVLPPEKTDFAELEIVSRWLGRHRDDSVQVRTDRYTSPDELLEAIRSYWPEVVRGGV